jgi:hypothetical protein
MNLLPLPARLLRAASLGAFLLAPCSPAPAALAAAAAGPIVFAPDGPGADCLAHAADLVETFDWLGSDFRLVSFLDGRVWLADGLGRLEFAGGDGRLAALSFGAVVDDALGFSQAGFLAPPAPEGGAGGLLVGFRRTAGGETIFGAMQFDYGADRSLTLSRFGAAAGFFDSAALLAIPEPAAGTALALAAAFSLLLRRCRRAGAA